MRHPYSNHCHRRVSQFRTFFKEANGPTQVSTGKLHVAADAVEASSRGGGSSVKTLADATLLFSLSSHRWLHELHFSPVSAAGNHSLTSRGSFARPSSWDGIRSGELCLSAAICLDVKQPRLTVRQLF